MKSKRGWLAGITSLLVVVLMGLTGCQTYYGGMTLPSGRYLNHYPQYFSPDPSFPLPREMADMEDPEGAARRAGVGGAAPAAPPAPPAPTGGNQ
jgi:hypothetical protein